MTTECNKCGQVYESRKALNTHKRWSHTPEWQKPRVLDYLHNEKGMAQREMAEVLNTTQQTISRYMIEFDIKREKPRNDPTKAPNHTFYKRGKGGIGGEYEKVQVMVDGENYNVAIHRLVALAHGIITIEEFYDDSFHIHHKSEHGLDNRPENLEGHDAVTHIEIHASQRENWGSHS